MVMFSRNKPSLITGFFILLLFTVMLSGCGKAGGTSPEAKPAASGTDSTPAPAPVDGTRTVKHIMGEAKIKGTPKRVVILTQEGTEALLELGMKPVGAVNSGLGNTWFPHIAKEMQGVTELGDESQPNIELIVSLKPDLIIGNKVRHEKVYKQLSDIAPTVFSEDLSGRWKQNFTLYAEALGKKAEGEKVMSKYNERVQQAKQKFGDKLSKKVSVVRFLPQAVRIYQKDTFAGIILKDIGFARPAPQDKEQFMEVITKERIADMDGDIMFYFNADYTDEKGGTKNQEEWMKDPLFKNLNIAKNNMAFKVDEVVWNLSGGIRSAQLLIDDLMKYAEKL